MLRVRVFSVAVQIPNEKEIAPRENDSVSIRCLCAIIIIVVLMLWRVQLSSSQETEKRLAYKSNLCFC